MKRLLEVLTVAIVAGVFGFGLVACKEEGPAEKAGRNFDDAMDDVGDKADEMGDDLKDAAEDTADDLEDAAEDTGDAIDDATD